MNFVLTFCEILCSNFQKFSDKCLTYFPAKLKILMNASREEVLNVTITSIYLLSYWAWKPGILVAPANALRGNIICRRSINLSVVSL